MMNDECRMMNMFAARFLYSPSEPILLKKKLSFKIIFSKKVYICRLKLNCINYD